MTNKLGVKQAPLTQSLLWLMTIGACLVVANNYYNQPLLGEIAREFSVTEAVANRVATITIFGYAMGLMLLVPLGDKFDKKILIGVDFIFIIGSLIAFGLSTSITMLMVSGFIIGFSSVVPQMFVPLVAQLSLAEDRNKNIGIVMGGGLLVFWDRGQSVVFSTNIWIVGVMSILSQLPLCLFFGSLYSSFFLALCQLSLASIRSFGSLS